MVVKHRARKQEDKLARRQSILVQASHLLGCQNFHHITMADVAKQCNLAKGTLYLYFRSKEELFLATLEQELAAWFDTLIHELGTTAPTACDPPAHFAQTVTRTLLERDTVSDLLPLVHSVLEHNIDRDTATAFKRMLVAKVQIGAQAVERVVPELEAGQGQRVMMHLHALVIGLRQMSTPSAPVAEVLALPEMKPIRVDFAQELSVSLTALLRGMIQSP